MKDEKTSKIAAHLSGPAKRRTDRVVVTNVSLTRRRAEAQPGQPVGARSPTHPTAGTGCPRAAGPDRASGARPVHPCTRRQTRCHNAQNAAGGPRPLGARLAGRHHTRVPGAAAARGRHRGLLASAASAAGGGVSKFKAALAPGSRKAKRGQTTGPNRNHGVAETASLAAVRRAGPEHPPHPFGAAGDHARGTVFALLQACGRGGGGGADHARPAPTLFGVLANTLSCRNGRAPPAAPGTRPLPLRPPNPGRAPWKPSHCRSLFERTLRVAKQRRRRAQTPPIGPTQVPRARHFRW